MSIVTAFVTTTLQVECINYSTNERYTHRVTLLSEVRIADRAVAGPSWSAVVREAGYKPPHIDRPSMHGIYFYE